MFSRTAKYAIKALTELAAGDRSLKIRELAQAAGIPQPFLAKLVPPWCRPGSSPPPGANGAASPSPTPRRRSPWPRQGAGLQRRPRLGKKARRGRRAGNGCPGSALQSRRNVGDRRPHRGYGEVHRVRTMRQCLPTRGNRDAQWESMGEFGPLPAMRGVPARVSDRSAELADARPRPVRQRSPSPSPRGMGGSAPSSK